MKKRNTPLVNILKLGRSLGLSDSEMTSLLRGASLEKEQACLSLGPPQYGGGHYGTISINDLER